MPTKADELLYNDAVKWINEHPQDKRIPDEIKQAFLSFNKLLPEKKAQLLITLRELLEAKKLPLEIEKSLPWLAFDLDGLPDEPILEAGAHLKSESDKSNLVSTSRRMYHLFQPKRFLDNFLQRVAFGKQNNAEALFTDIYQGNEKKIQEALLHRGKLTDYSGREFNCTAYEYAYWAKDTHMCRMLERHMDDETKAVLLERINVIDATGLVYQQNGQEHLSKHFDFSPLIQALQFYVDNYDAWYAACNWAAMEAAWMNVGLAQRDVPAHVAQEYCRTDRAFYPCPPFNEPALPRILTFYSWMTSRAGSWFPLTSSNSGLGFDFALLRGGPGVGPVTVWARGGLPAPSAGAARDLAAVSRLDEVRTVDLTQSREHLNPPAAPSMSV